MKDKDFYLIQEAYAKVNEQSDKPNWLYQPLKRLAREREDANFNSYWGNWNQNVAPKLADVMNKGQESPVAPPQTAGNVPSPLDNYSRDEINQINSQPKRNIHPMDADAMKKENGVVISNLLASIERQYPDFPKSYSDGIRQDMEKVVDDYTQNMLQKTGLEAKATSLPMYRKELRDKVEELKNNVYNNIDNDAKQVEQDKKDPNAYLLRPTGDPFQDSVNKQEYSKRQFASQPIGTIRVDNGVQAFPATK